MGENSGGAEIAKTVRDGIFGYKTKEKLAKKKLDYVLNLKPFDLDANLETLTLRRYDPRKYKIITIGKQTFAVQEKIGF